MVIIQWTALAYSYWSHKHGYLWQEPDKELYVNDNKYLSSKQTKLITRERITDQLTPSLTVLPRKVILQQ